MTEQAPALSPEFLAFLRWLMSCPPLPPAGGDKGDGDGDGEQDGEEFQP